MLDRNALRDYCLSLTGAFEDFPFGIEVAVMKVKDKMFAILPVDASPLSISLKADPDEAILQREQYKAITPGYHLNKRHWNSVLIDGEIDDERVLELIEDSYLLVRQGLTKKVQAELAAMEKEASGN
jgi:predicted DNA-binding protein (MmcQ/YjbR family)